MRNMLYEGYLSINVWEFKYYRLLHFISKNKIKVNKRIEVNLKKWVKIKREWDQVDDRNYNWTITNLVNIIVNNNLIIIIMMMSRISRWER